MHDTDVAALLARVPQWDRALITVAPLSGGITNENWVATIDGRRHVVRVPGDRTDVLGIDRGHEAEAANRAARLGIGPPITGVLPEVGTLITEFIPGEHLEPAPFASRLDDVIDLVRRFHDGGAIAGQFPIHRVVEQHARDALANGVPTPAAFPRLHEQSRRIETAFGRAPVAPVPCHNDLLPGNVLFDHAGGVWLLDFEYAGMNDRYFDLGNLSVNCGLDDSADEYLVERYFGTVTPARLARLRLMKVMSEFREGMWAVVQQAISNLDTDFVAYAEERLHHCEELASSPQFDTWIEAAALSG